MSGIIPPLGGVLRVMRCDLATVRRDNTAQLGAARCRSSSPAQPGTESGGEPGAAAKPGINHRDARPVQPTSPPLAFPRLLKKSITFLAGPLLPE